MHRFQLLGIISLLLGAAILFFLRDPFYAFLVTVLQIIGILFGLLLVVIGIGLILGGGWIGRRRRWGIGSTIL